MIGFTTIRQEEAGSAGGTHLWVSDELITAASFDIPFVEVREKDVEGGGMRDENRQLIHYEESQRDRCIVEIAKLMQQWRRSSVRVQLLPQDIAEKIRPFLRGPGLRVTYRLLTGAKESQPKETTLLPIAGGLYVRIADLQPSSLVSVSVEAFGKPPWNSDYESVDTAVINLKEWHAAGS